MKLMELKSEIDLWLNNYFEAKNGYHKIIYEAMNYSLSVGGKRIRPILALLCYSLYKPDYEKIMPIAGAVEMIHTYSLIHDDLPSMDNDDLRRGKPTNHRVYGEALAILAGDGLLNEAMNVLFNFCTEHHHAISACKLISNSAGAEGMIAGQVVDIINEGKLISEEELSYMHRNKTGALIKASILSGAILGGASEKHIEILSSFGDKLGLAFQVKDDLLDVLGDSALLGKTIKKDMNHNKTTYVSLYGLEKCEDICKALTEQCLLDLKKLDKDTELLENLTLNLLERNN